MADWRVGQEVVVDEGSRRKGAQSAFAGVVTKVARKYFTVEYSRDNDWKTDMQFTIIDGSQREDNPQYPQYYPGHCYTPESWEAKKYRDELDERLRTDHRVFSSASDSTMATRFWTDGELLELVELLDRVKTRRNTKDLDTI